MRIGNFEFKRYQDELEEEVPEVEQKFKLVTRIDSPLYEKYNFGRYNPDELYKKKGGFQIFDKMREDDQISAVLNLIKYIILGSAWDIETENEDIKEFIKWNFNEYLDEIFIKKLYNILSAIDYGFSLTEKVFEQYNGKIVLKSLKTRPPHSFDFQQDKFGKILDIIQTVMDGEIHLDPTKFVHYAYQEEFDNPYGKSALNGGVYRAYWSKDAIIKFMNIYLERHGMPLGIGTVPQGASQAAIDDLKKIGKNLQAKTFAVIKEGFTIDFKEAQKGTDVYERAIDQYNTAIARSLLLPDLLGLSGSKTGGGSYNLGEKQFEIFYQTIDFERRKLERLVTDELIKPLVTWNFGESDAKFSFQPVDKSEKKELVKIWLDAVKSKTIPITDEQINWFLNTVEAPEISPEELAAIKEEKAAMAEQISGKNTEENQEVPPGKKLAGIEKQNPKEDVTKEFTENLDGINSETQENQVSIETAEKGKVRQPNQYEKNVNFSEIETSLNNIETKYLNLIADGFKLSINALFDEIKRKKIIEKKRFDLINKLNLKYQPSMTKAVKDLLKEAYQYGFGSTKKEYLIENITDLGNDDIAAWISSYAFDVTNMESGFILNKIKPIISEGIRTGLSIKDIIKMCDDALQGYDITRGRAKLETTVRTIASTAFNEGRAQQFGELSDDIIGFTYSAIIDGRETELCRRLDEKKIAKNDFTLYNTPNHFNCRSILIPVFKGEGEGDDGNGWTPDAPAVIRTGGNFLKLA